MTPILWIFVGLLTAKVVAEFVLSQMNAAHVRAHSGEVPGAYREFIDEQTYRKSVDYTLAKQRFGTVELFYDAAVLAVVVLSGLLPWLWGAFTGLFGDDLWAQALTLFGVGILLSIPGLPLDWWDTFKLEQKFGFNKSTFGLWVSDKFKGLAVGCAIGFPLLCLLLLIVRLPLWWLWAAVVFFAFQLLMMIVYPMFIMPLFNKFEPMEEGSLRARLLGLAERTGFLCKTILVMDGSKRSAHSNAFFTGFGKARRVVLFDTLVEQLSEGELEAVLAHEIGHFKLGHIWKMIALSGVMIFVGFGAMGWLAESAWFLEGFGFAYDAPGRMAKVFLLFSIVSGLVGFWLTPLTARRSRKHEFEADAFAREAVKASEPLIGALRKLNEKNLSNLTPHPAYSGFYYSHPTLIEREAALRGG